MTNSFDNLLLKIKEEFNKACKNKMLLQCPYNCKFGSISDGLEICFQKEKMKETDKHHRIVYFCKQCKHFELKL